jgi:hypothetical protein
MAIGVNLELWKRRLFPGLWSLLYSSADFWGHTLQRARASRISSHHIVVGQLKCLTRIRVAK